MLSTTFGELTFSSTANGSSAVKGFTNVAICVVGSSKQAFTAFTWEGWMKGSSPLYIDYHIKVAPDLCARLIAAVGTTFMINGSHDNFSSECFYGSFNTFVIGSHISIIQDARYLFVYTLYHRLPPSIANGFAGKRVDA